MLVEEAIAKYAQEPLSNQLLSTVLKGYRRPYDKIYELVKSGFLIKIRNGYYLAGPKIIGHKAELFLVANRMYGPSYISLESALSHWRLIPEKTFETSSVTTKRSKQYSTPIGRFSYVHAPLPYYSFGLRSVQLTPQQVVIMATPEKAICDKILFTSGIRLRSTKEALQFLTEDLRIDEEELQKLDIKEIKLWVEDAPKKESIHTLIKTLEQL